MFFFFNDTATTEIYTLSLHDALPISPETGRARCQGARDVGHRHARHCGGLRDTRSMNQRIHHRSEEHTSELQSQSNLVCRLLLEKKKNSASMRLVNVRLTVA